VKTKTTDILLLGRLHILVLPAGWGRREVCKEFWFPPAMACRQH